MQLYDLSEYAKNKSAIYLLEKIHLKGNLINKYED
jgi:hypothetical protein